MKNIITVATLLLIPSSLFSNPITDPATSPHVVILQGHVESGAINTSTENSKAILSQIRNQLKFTIGTLNAYGGGTAIDYSLETNINKVSKTESGFRVNYDAKVLIAWNRGYQVPSQFTFVLPVRADGLGLKQFYDTHSKSCTSGEDYGWSGFFYTYRPNNCNISSFQNPTHGIRTTIKFSPTEDHSNKAPEYDEIWKDNQLRAIAVFGNTKSRTLVNFRNQMKRWFGRPQKDQSTNFQNFYMQALEYRHPRGKIIVDLFYFKQGNIASMGEEFGELYRDRTLSADFIAYNGHSGLGANIRALTRRGDYQSDQYKVFFLNGCDTFSYLDHHIIDLHHQLNPNHSPTKFVDIVTTAIPSMFDQMGFGTARILLGLANARENYHSILRGFTNGVPIVIGEEDNG